MNQTVGQIENGCIRFSYRTAKFGDTVGGYA